MIQVFSMNGFEDNTPHGVMTHGKLCTFPTSVKRKSVIAVQMLYCYVIPTHAFLKWLELVYLTSIFSGSNITSLFAILFCANYCYKLIKKARLIFFFYSVPCQQENDQNSGDCTRTREWIRLKIQSNKRSILPVKTGGGFVSGWVLRKGWN